MKTIFVMQIQNTIDLITNSSSELFVLKGGTKEAVIQMLDNIDTAWRKEYAEPKNISELSANELETYFSYACSAHMWPAKKSMHPVLNGFTFDELYEEDKEHGKNWDGSVDYKLKNNKDDSRWGNFVTDGNKDSLIGKLDPEKKMWFLFSFDDNPNWDLQEQLMDIAERYHLG
jgi:hypothetical protein